MVRISRLLVDQIVSDMASDPMRERCGLLLGSIGNIEDWLPAANVHAHRERHFELDPAMLLAALRMQRQGGRAVLGHVHSHPGGESVPSQADAEAADGDGRLWMIVGSEGPRLWRTVGGGHHLGAFEMVGLSIIDEA